MKKIGLLAGTGEMPRLWINSARARGYNVVVLALPGAEDLEPLADCFHRLEKIEWQHFIDLLQQEGLEEVTAAGRFDKKLLFQALGRGKNLFRLLGAVRNRSEEEIINILVGDLEKKGIRVRPQKEFLQDFIPSPGILTGDAPDDDLKGELELVLNRALQLSKLGIGQTVAVKKGVVVAVEAMEGTDRTIMRAHELAGEGIVVAKVGWREDYRQIEQPVVGPDTLELLIKIKARALVLEAGRVMLLDGPNLLKKAEENHLLIVAEEVGDWADI